MVTARGVENENLPRTRTTPMVQLLYDDGAIIAPMQQPRCASLKLWKGEVSWLILMQWSAKLDPEAKTLAIMRYTLHRW